MGGTGSRNDDAHRDGTARVCALAVKLSVAAAEAAVLAVHAATAAELRVEMVHLVAAAALKFGIIYTIAAAFRAGPTLAAATLLSTHLCAHTAHGLLTR